MVDGSLFRTVTKAWVLMALLPAVLVAPRRAHAAERPRIAVAVERPGELSLPRELGEGAGGRALSQGVWEACLEAGTLRPRAKHVECETLRDVPDAQVCVDEVVERALRLEIGCEGAGATAEAIDLSRSGCDTGDCFAAAAGRAGATDLLVVHAVWKDGLSLAGTITNLATGRARTVSAQDFEKTYNSEWPRSGSQVLALLKWFSRRLALEILTDRTWAGGKGDSAGTSPPMLVSPAPGAIPVPPSRSRRWIGWTLIGAGTVAGAAAGIVWGKDKDLADCVPVAGDGDPCREVHRTVIPTIVLGAGAAAALVAGSIVLISGRDGGANVAFSLHPSGVLLGGRF